MAACCVGVPGGMCWSLACPLENRLSLPFGGQLCRACLVRFKMSLTGSSCLEPRSPSSDGGPAVADRTLPEVRTGSSPHSEKKESLTICLLWMVFPQEPSGKRKSLS